MVHAFIYSALQPVKKILKNFQNMLDKLRDNLI